MLEIIAALFKSIKVGFKLVSKGSQEVSIAMGKLDNDPCRQIRTVKLGRF